VSIEPGYVAVIVTVILALLAGGMYVIRSEVLKGNKTAEAAHVELIPDHGLTLRDAIDRIETRQMEDRTTFSGHVADIHSDIKAIRARIDDHIDHHTGG